MEKEEKTQATDQSRRKFLKSTSFSAAGILLTPLIAACGGDDDKKSARRRSGGTGKSPAANTPSNNDNASGNSAKLQLVNNVSELGAVGNVRCITKTTKAGDAGYISIDSGATDYALASKVNNSKGPYKEDFVVSEQNGMKGVANVLFVVQPSTGKALKNTGAPKGINGNFRFTRMMVVGQGQSATYMVTDPVKHNINVVHDAFGKVSDKNPDVGTPEGVASTSDPISIAGMYSVKCSMHNWEQGYLFCSEHAHVGVTGSSYDPDAYRQGPLGGSVEISSIPVGTHSVEVWHEGAKVKTLQVTVEEGKTVDLSVEL